MTSHLWPIFSCRFSCILKEQRFVLQFTKLHEAVARNPFLFLLFFFKLNLIRFKYRTKWCGLGCLTPIVLKPTGVWTSVFSSLSHNLSSDISSDHCHFNNIPEIAWWVTYSKQFNSSLSNSEPLPCTLLGIVKFYCFFFFFFTVQGIGWFGQNGCSSIACWLLCASLQSFCLLIKLVKKWLWDVWFSILEIL